MIFILCGVQEEGKVDKTRAGKMMVAAGKTMSYTGRNRLSTEILGKLLIRELTFTRCLVMKKSMISVLAVDNFYVFMVLYFSLKIFLFRTTEVGNQSSFGSIVSGIIIYGLIK